LAETTLDLINLATPGFGSDPSKMPPSGIYHCAPGGETSWFEYAQLVINTAKAAGAARACKALTPISTAEYPTAAERPFNSRLDTQKLQKVLGNKLPDWQDDVIATVHQVVETQES
jgi:dTDP-4-dehydrorhamnose reductase